MTHTYGICIASFFCPSTWLITLDWIKRNIVNTIFINVFRLQDSDHNTAENVSDFENEVLIDSETNEEFAKSELPGTEVFSATEEE